MSAFIPHIHFDSKDYPPDAAYEVWRQAMAATYDTERLDDTPFTATIDAWAIDDILLSDTRLPAIRFQRDPAKILREGGDNYVFMHLQDGASTCMSEDGPPALVAQGETLVLDMTKPFRGEGPLSRSYTVSVPRQKLIAAMRDERDVHCMVISGRLGRLLADHLTSIAALASEIPQSEASIFARTTVQLMAACLTPQAAQKGDTPLLAFAARHDITRCIDLNLHRADLDPSAICNELGISRAAAYRAFSGTDGIASLIRTRRMRAARTMLENPAERRAVAEVASAVGYADAALFSRVYRRVFGQTPSESRSQDRSPVEIRAKANRSADLRQWVRDIDQHLNEHKI